MPNGVNNLVTDGFRFITGVAAKPIYLIRTPVAAITVRGTIFDVFVEEGGAVWILLHESAVTVCNNSGKCREFSDPAATPRAHKYTYLRPRLYRSYTPRLLNITIGIGFGGGGGRHGHYGY